MDLGDNIQNNTANDNNDSEDHQEVQDFRDMLSKETNRMTSLCDYWESKISSISEDPSYEEIRGGKCENMILTCSRIQIF